MGVVIHIMNIYKRKGECSFYSNNDLIGGKLKITINEVFNKFGYLQKLVKTLLHLLN